MIDGTKIVKRIDSELVKQNIKRISLLQYCELPQNAMTHWNKRGTVPSADKLYKIAQYLNVSLEYLLTGKTESGIPQDVLNLAYDVMTFDKSDIDEITAIIELKKRKYIKQNAP